jgi:hypothetical protein
MIKPLLFSSALLFCFQSFAQSFIIQETNIKKNTSQCINLAKKCKMVLLKKQTMYTLPFSSKSTITNNFLNQLSEKFMRVYPKEASQDVDGTTIERLPGNEREQVVKLTYGFLAPNTNQTTDYVLLSVSFDNSGTSPKVDKIIVQNKEDLGILTLTERDKLAFKPKPAAKPATKTASKPATKTTTKPASKKK